MAAISRCALRSADETERREIEAIREIARNAKRDLRAAHSGVDVVLWIGIVEKLTSAVLCFLMTPSALICNGGQ